MPALDPSVGNSWTQSLHDRVAKCQKISDLNAKASLFPGPNTGLQAGQPAAPLLVASTAAVQIPKFSTAPSAAKRIVLAGSKEAYVPPPQPLAYSDAASFEAARAPLKGKHRLAKATRSRHVADRDEEILAPVADTGDGEHDELDQDEIAASIEQERPNWGDCSTFSPPQADVVTDAHKANGKVLCQLSSRFLYRVSASEGAGHTRGSTTQLRIRPSASVNRMPVCDNIYSIPSRSSLCHNLAGRLLWTNSKRDQFTSYTNSLKFALVLAQRRRVMGQTGITISCIETRKVKTLKGQPAEFFYVPDLLRAFGVLEWDGLTSTARAKLAGPWFSNESVAHGELDLTDNPSKQVDFDELVAHGLYAFRPGSHVEGEEEEERKFVFRSMQLSYAWYGAAAGSQDTMLEDDYYGCGYERLNHAAVLARMFSPDLTWIRPGQILPEKIEQDLADLPAFPLQVLLDFLGMRRPLEDLSLFRRFVNRHSNANDVQEVLYDSMTRIPNNSPDKMQTMVYIREVCKAVGVTPPGPNKIGMADTLFDYHGVWEGDIKKIIGPRQSWRRNKPIGSEASVTTQTPGPRDPALEGSILNREQLGKRLPSSMGDGRSRVSVLNDSQAGRSQPAMSRDEGVMTIEPLKVVERREDGQQERPIEESYIVLPLPKDGLQISLTLY